MCTATIFKIFVAMLRGDRYGFTRIAMPLSHRFLAASPKLPRHLLWGLRMSLTVYTGYKSKCGSRIVIFKDQVWFEKSHKYYNKIVIFSTKHIDIFLKNEQHLIMSGCATKNKTIQTYKCIIHIQLEIQAKNLPKFGMVDMCP